MVDDAHRDTLLEPVSVSTTKKYIAGIAAWHLTQGWEHPLNSSQQARILRSLRGLENIQSSSRRLPPRPPITIPMLQVLRITLELDKPFDACIWAMCACSFWGLMRFGEVSVKSRASWSGEKHLKRSDLSFGCDLDGRRFAELALPSAKTARPGEVQTIILAEEGSLCPLQALRTLLQVVPAVATDPLFAWVDGKGTIRPMVRARALARINNILQAWQLGTSFGHSFRIGGASWYLAQGISPEMVRLAGRWRSLAFEVYIRAFHLIAPRHLQNLDVVGLGGVLQPQSD